MIDIEHRAGFLDRIHLFNGLKEGELEGIAAKLEERAYAKDDVIFERGAKPDGFYMIFKGKVKVARPREKGEEFLAWLTAGDYFGEEALFENRNRSATIRAMEDSALFFLSRQDFDSLLAKYPKLEPNFQVAIKSRKLARATLFKWLGANEVIYFIARRHKIRLYQVLIAPLFSLAVPIILFAWAFMAQAVTPTAVGVVLLIGIVLWAAWVWVDWSNDYYIVTNQRVVWVERVIGIYDSRQEAPLSTILSVGVETDVIGRALDYGHISVRTFVGNIRFEYVDHPNQAADLIRELWERSKSKGVFAQKEAMKNALRSKLGLPLHKLPEEPLPPVVPDDTTLQKKGLLRIVLGNLFKLRTEEGGTVIYHKHWIVLLQQMLRPLVFFLILLGLLISRFWNLWGDSGNAVFEKLDSGGFRPDTIIVTILFFMLIFLGWMVWEYIDWNNDIFKVTPEEIIDLDRTPLGTEERRAAQIENILSTEYKRIGPLGYVFNYGTVYIVVGGTKLSFQDVLDPAGVQADINRRRMARIAKKNEDSANVERERMATWLAAYHQNIKEFTPGSTKLEEDDIQRLTRAGIQLPEDELQEDIEDMLDEGMDDQSMDGAEG
ncbi:MAG: cyclic nucleotide-binding domain-containing protein [Anaerolineaceae bacterium]|nr:MAG: cyclic nucleotide-binding domain-containing protein [Anaerolineaceae bacterium]